MTLLQLRRSTNTAAHTAQDYNVYLTLQQQQQQHLQHCSMHLSQCM